MDEAKKAYSAKEWLKVFEAIRYNANKVTFTKRGYDKYIKDQLARLDSKCNEIIEQEKILENQK